MPRDYAKSILSHRISIKHFYFVKPTQLIQILLGYNSYSFALHLGQFYGPFSIHMRCHSILCHSVHECMKS